MAFWWNKGVFRFVDFETKVTIVLTGILYKAYSDLDLQKKKSSDLYTNLIPKITLWVKNSILTNSRVLISNMIFFFFNSSSKYPYWSQVAFSVPI